jgi:hypothetical protein
MQRLEITKSNEESSKGKSSISAKTVLILSFDLALRT